MENKIAAVLIKSLLERIELDQSIGAVSSLEREALVQALAALGDPQTGASLVPSAAPNVPAVVEPAKSSVEEVMAQSPVAAAAAPTLPDIALVLTANERNTPTDKDLMLCLDFGTAMSKAFATVEPFGHLELELGKAAGKTGHALPSSVFIGDNGKAYFGFEAIDRSQDLIESGRERLDSIKTWLSLGRDVDLDDESCLLPKALNPTVRIPLIVTDDSGIVTADSGDRDRAWCCAV